MGHLLPACSLVQHVWFSPNNGNAGELCTTEKRCLSEGGLGGSGSGRRQRYQRRTTEGYLALDIAVLRRRGLFAARTFDADARSGETDWASNSVLLSKLPPRTAKIADRHADAVPTIFVADNTRWRS